MSAFLSHELDQTFQRAKDVEDFFDKKEMHLLRSVYESREQPRICSPKDSCMTNLFFGFFFDGTKNNYVQANEGKNHSNVARLYDCYPGRSVPGVLPKDTDWQKDPHLYQHFFKVYAPGVSSPFKEVGDHADWLDEPTGGAGGRMGERRILWGLIQAINNIHRYFLGTPLVLQSEVNAILGKAFLNKWTRAKMTGERPRLVPYAGKRGFRPEAHSTARLVFEPLLLRLHKAIAQHRPDKKSGIPAKISPAIVKTIHVSVFGFSRGATQARAFTNWLQSLCRLDAQLSGRSGDMSLGGLPVCFDFLGLFDTVASIGLGNTLGGSTGHGAWADNEDSLRIPPDLRCLHLVAAHEIRRSFPVDSISVGGVVSPAHEEVVIPGVHSDIGCGYCPTEQGRGTDPNGDDMLARIPLLLMYKSARLNGVPLKLEQASPSAQTRFAVTKKTIDDFNAYITTCNVKAGPLHRIMREQARKQIEWRYWRRPGGRNPLQSSESFKKASVFDQNDLYSAALEFEGEVKKFYDWRAAEGNGAIFKQQERGFGNDHESEWREIASWWKDEFSPPRAVIDFFDNYVHDSRAWFKLFPGNPDSEPKAHKQLQGWQARREIGQTDARLPVLVGRADYKVVSDRLSPAQRKAADEYKTTQKIPRMITAGREPWQTPINWLAGAGYLRFRKVFGGDTVHLLSDNKATPADASILAGIDHSDDPSASA